MERGQLSDRWLDKRILFVSGKGGVGKSLIAAAAAREAVRAGRRTLLVELGRNSYFKDFWHLPAVDHVPRPTGLGFDCALWSGATCLREYVLHYLRMGRLYDVFFENKVMQSLIAVAPGLAEISVLGKITSGLRSVGPPLDYDLIVVDCYATGHALALLRAPRGMAEAIHFGPMGAHSREIEAVLTNPELCAYLAVTLLEELPVSETLEFVQSLRTSLGASCAIVGNKRVQSAASPEQLAQIAAKNAGPLADFARYLRTSESRQSRYAALFATSTIAGTIAGTIASVPMIYASDPTILVETAAEALRSA